MFIDDGWPGVTFTRHAFTERMELAEQGKIANLIVKDHSRLGRNRLLSGQLLEEEFDRPGIRYIAIMNNIDTAKGISDIVPMQDLLNEWHAKNTSQKVSNVFRSKGMSVAPLTTNPPFGYCKNPELVHEFIEKIAVSAPRYVDGKRVPILNFYYNGVGIIRGFSPEEMKKNSGTTQKDPQKNTA